MGNEQNLHDLPQESFEDWRNLNDEEVTDPSPTVDVYDRNVHAIEKASITVRRFYFATAVFALFLCEILIKFYTQWQF